MTKEEDEREREREREREEREGILNDAQLYAHRYHWSGHGLAAFFSNQETSNTNG
ncbi:unnamed protein product [Musa acuminata subsp. malaccensis]|uniref:(wild Malaysian banana) hypothetical protein n=1 Tax=Musa acuminata subsp. malaccensis TaxID=214687 RepID=A0A804K2L5_MUSAM|nr:unnamed protein product [Musa acuminata subsp. malaccensis]